MRRRTLIIVLIAALAGALLAGGAYWRWTNSPRYALQRMALAIKTRNMPEVFKYLDLKSILNNFIDAASREPANPDCGKEDEWTRMSRSLGGKFARMFLPQLFDSFEKEIKMGMGKYLQNLDNTQILAIAAAATTAQIEMQADDEAKVTLVDPKSKKPLRFQMSRQPETGTWQVVSINYQDLKSLAKAKF
ncbi:MAG: hypothetical protein M1438_04020 [Deltaproteobacteria bacterium]|nr:hypothetical protein [Deltaproteobacteria bacterium]